LLWSLSFHIIVSLLSKSLERAASVRLLHHIIKEKEERDIIETMTTFLTVLAVVLSAVAVLPVVAASTDTSGLSWTIYHSWNQNQEFVKRGSLVWDKSEESEKNEFQIVNDQELQAKDVSDMLDYGWYHVKIQGSDGSFVFQTVPSCNLRRANFKDSFEITLPRSSLGNKQDPLLSFSYTPLVSPLAPKTCEEYDALDDAKSFSSRVSAQMDTPAMTLKTVLSEKKPPPGIKFAKTPSGGTTASQGEEDEGNPTPEAAPSPFGFLQKYWYIIVPMLIMQMISVPEEEGKPQEEGQQQGAQTGGTIAPPQAAAASNQKARRGKTSKNKN